MLSKSTVLEILLHVLNIASAKARTETVYRHLNLKALRRCSLAFFCALAWQVPPLIFERYKHSKQLIYLSQNDLLILLALVWCQNHYNVDGFNVNRTNHSKALGLNIDEALSWKEHIHSLPVTVHFSESDLLFPYTLLLKFTKVLSSHILITTVFFGMACLDSRVRNFKNYKIVLPE